MSATPLHSVTPVDVIRSTLEDTLKLQRAAYLAHPYPSFHERRADLLKLKAFIRDNRDAIVAAINADYGNRSRHETLFAEIFSVMDGVDHTLKHLKKWMKPQRRSVDLKNFLAPATASSRSPWALWGPSCPGIFRST